ncbi:hypothetical protein [Paenibacillus sinopodophylli]|uniref:hypothetical protein n=1 Tax=Paenibacillus sinopodophylli TaxID=1837342 RepID=UPI00110C93F0|nr:hypothetical protein [Paenibacillus sinopodophylli]
MGLWKGAWYLARHELVRDGWKSLFTLLFVGYLLLFTVPMMYSSLTGDTNQMMNWATDFLYLTFLPILGFVINQTMMRFWKENSYTRKMALWRILPISSRQIALGRIIQLFIVLFCAQFVYFSMQFIIVRMMGADVSVGTFILYAVFWFGYSLATAITYVYWEIGHSGKMYFISNLIYIAIMLVVSISFTTIKGWNMVGSSLQAIQNGSWWMPIVAIAAGVAAVFIGVNRIEHRLEKRSYLA